MNFLTQPLLYNRLMDERRLLDDVYSAVSALDLSGAVLAALKAMRLTGTVPTATKTKKDSDESRAYRLEGNDHYFSKRYLKALECYNKALLVAPKGTIGLLLAYSNRSALLFNITAFRACLDDIETCFKLGCTGALAIKLQKRKDDCLQLMWYERSRNKIMLKGFPKEFFKFDVKKHVGIPCLSADVDVISVSGERQVVAAKDIKMGSVIALEEAFTTYSTNNKSKVACHYCQKMSFNLISCDTCCYALFCSTKCKTLCISEYHDVECQIMDILEAITVGPRLRLAIKTALKLKTKCKGWSKLIEESKNIGASRLKDSSVRQAYDVNKCASVLCFKEDRHFVHGPLYNSCFMYATILHYLENIDGFFPASPLDRLKAKECFAKICMSLGTLHTFVTGINNAADIMSAGTVGIDLPCHYGLFAFTGKLKHSCDANVMVLGLDNRVALLAIQPIKKMSEITVSYVGYYYDHLYGNNRALQVYRTTFNVCNCVVCKDSWGFKLYQRDPNPEQITILNNWERQRFIIMFRHRDPLFFEETCKTFAALRDLANTVEHLTIFAELRTQLSFSQFAETFNATV